MFSRKSSTPKEIGSLIGSGTVIEGDVSFTGGLRIDGTVRGSVRCTEGEKSGMLVISEQGSVSGEVRAAHIVVAGRIDGPIVAGEVAELQPKAQVHGDVQYRALEMHHGAVVIGRLVHVSESVRSAAPLKLAVGSDAGHGGD